MIGHITGKIFELRAGSLILKVGGLGLIVHTTPICLENLEANTEASFFAHTAVRENSIDLYGFETKRDLDMFELLIGVTGVGPKSALAILSVAGIQNIEKAVISKDTGVLTKVSGIGRKTAERIVLELDGKVTGDSLGESSSEDLEVFDALKALGYKERRVAEVLRTLPPELEGVSSKLKYAIKNLNNS